MDPRAFLDRLIDDPDREPSLVHVEELEARSPVPLPFPEGFPEILIGRLGLLGIESLYAHQREGLDALRAGDDVAMATGTASGKSLVYQAAFAEDVLMRPKATALLLFPTKALARDQLRALRSLKLPQLKAAVYDGDTPQAERPLVRRNANAVLTNPDMLHLVLSDHPRWADFLFRLSLVVVDEAHVLRGVFGSNVAMVLRRLRRLIDHAGGTPRWCLASATVGNPDELVRELTGLDVRVVTDDASPRGRKLFALWNPPVVDDETGARRSALSEASTLMAELVDDDVRTIGFVRSRRAAELLAEFTRRAVGSAARPRPGQELPRRLPGRGPPPARDASSRRASCSRWRRRARWSSGSTSVRSTPRCSPATRARGRRCGSRRVARGGASTGRSRCSSRRTTRSTSTWSPTPSDLFRLPPEAAVIDPANPYVARAAPAVRGAGEPLADDEVARYFGGEAATTLEALVEDGVLVRRSTGRVHDAGGGSPHRDVDIRAGAGHVYRIVRPTPARCSARATSTAPSRRSMQARSTCTRASSSWSRSSTWCVAWRSSRRPTPTSTRRPATSRTSISSTRLTIGRWATRSCGSATST